MTRTNSVFDLPDGSQVLVTVWESGRMSIAFRQRGWHSWGAPIFPVYVENIPNAAPSASD